MAKASGNKLKLLLLKEHLERNSDENHPIKLSQMMEYLSENGVKAERKSIYNDIETLKDSGVDIEKGPVDGTTGYYIANRRFQTPELKLLVDAVQCSRFITHKKSAELINKLGELTSCHIARGLKRQVLVSGRIKHMNESIYYNTDIIHTAIAENKSITFKYFEYNLQKEYVLKRDGAKYHVSPLALAWNDSNYYMIAFESGSETVKNYRVDKMMGISLTNEPRKGLDKFSEAEAARYTQKMFSMYSGSEQSVRLRFRNRLIGVVIDRFGKDVEIYPDGDWFMVKVDVVVSPQFFGWLAGLGGDVQIAAPAEAAVMYRRHLSEILESM